MDPLAIIFSIIILVMSVVIHELSHGYMAEMLGDPTPRLQGRLTLNPLKHLDPVGSFLVPILTSFAGFTFGWAKPVMWNPYNVKNKRMGEFLISIAGPMSNILVALVFGFMIRFWGDIFSSSFVTIAQYIVFINIILAIFNLIPVPPLDGSKIIFSLLPPRLAGFREALETNSMIFLFVAVIFLWQIVSPIVPYLYRLIVGS